MGTPHAPAKGCRPLHSRFSSLSAAMGKKGIMGTPHAPAKGCRVRGTIKAAALCTPAFLPLHHKKGQPADDCQPPFFVNREESLSPAHKTAFPVN